MIKSRNSRREIKRKTIKSNTIYMDQLYNSSILGVPMKIKEDKIYSVYVDSYNYNEHFFSTREKANNFFLRKVEQLKKLYK